LKNSSTGSLEAIHFLEAPGTRIPPDINILGGNSNDEESKLDRLIAGHAHQLALSLMSSGIITAQAVKYLNDIYKEWASNRMRVARKLRSGVPVTQDDMTANLDVCDVYTKIKSRLAKIVK